MTDTKPTIIKKYANRRLYNTGTSTYVTLDDLGTMVKAGEEFQVVDAKSGDDITRSVLTQIIFEEESRGQNLLPINFLRSLIGFYGDQMQALVPSYLEVSMDQFALEQDRLRSEWAKTMSSTAIDALNEQVRRNMELWQRAARMFSPFPVDEEHADEIGAAHQSGSPQSSASERGGAAEIDVLKRQLADLQQRLDGLAKTEEKTKS